MMNDRKRNEEETKTLIGTRQFMVPNWDALNTHKINKNDTHTIEDADVIYTSREILTSLCLVYFWFQSETYFMKYIVWIFYFNFEDGIPIYSERRMSITRQTTTLCAIKTVFPYQRQTAGLLNPSSEHQLTPSKPWTPGCETLKTEDNIHFVINNPHNPNSHTLSASPYPSCPHLTSEGLLCFSSLFCFPHLCALL